MISRLLFVAVVSVSLYSYDRGAAPRVSKETVASIQSAGDAARAASALCQSKPSACEAVAKQGGDLIKREAEAQIRALISEPEEMPPPKKAKPEKPAKQKQNP